MRTTKPYCFMEGALDLVSEFVAIATITKNMESEFLVDISFMNLSFRTHLGYAAHASYNDCNGKFYELAFTDKEKFSGLAFIQTEFTNETFFITNGTFKKEESTFIVTLRTAYDEHYLLKKLFNSCEMHISVMEMDEDSYSWRHILPNKYFSEYMNKTVKQLQTEPAETRHGETMRKLVWDACMRSKAKGAMEPLESDIIYDKKRSTSTVQLFQYIEENPITKKTVVGALLPLWAFLGVSPKRVQALEEFFDNAPFIMGVADLKDDQVSIVFVNEAAANQIHTTKGEFPHIWQSRDPGRTIEKIFIKMYKETLASESVVTSRVIFPGEHGDLMLDAVCSCLSVDHTTGVSRHSFILADRTQQRKAEAELEKHRDTLEDAVKIRTRELELKENHVRSIVSNAPNIILTVNQEGVIVFANRGFVNDDTESIIGVPLHTLVEGGVDLHNEILTLFSPASKPFKLEAKLLDKDIWLNISAGPMNEHQAIIVATDITEIKQLSVKLDHALKTKSRFLANMSHEIRTPLSGIIGMSRLLLDTGLTMDQTECVATIQYCGETLHSVINDVLDFTKLEATGEMMLDRSEISLQTCSEECLYTVLPAAQKKNLELIIDTDPRLPDRIMGDPTRVRQVILNLLNNAVKFTDSGHIILGLSGMEHYGTDEWTFICSIKDTGCGVPAESQGKLFQMFSQVDVSTTRRFGGTGIGLALTKRFLEMMDGDISMKSTGIPGEGSTFTFTLTTTIAPFAPISPSSGASPRWLIESASVYVRAKNEVAAEVLKRRLNAKGFVSIHVIPTSAALTQIRTKDERDSSASKENCIIFCDIEELSYIRSELLGDSSVVIVAMGYTRTKTFEADYPTCEFLRKPIKEVAFVRCLREVWGKLDQQLKKNSGNSLQKVPSNGLKQVRDSLLGHNLPLSILIAEDNEINQKVVKRVFQQLGYKNVVFANNGQECLTLIEKNGIPDFILMDVQMPVLDGVETTKIIRKRYSGNWPYIASMTADVFPEDRKNCLDAGMDDFLTKPIRVELLQVTLAKCYKLKLVREGSYSPPLLSIPA